MLELLSLSYKIFQQPLIDQIDLSFKPGILYGIVGPNGAGKSTLLKTIAGIWSATSGAVVWQGKALHRAPRYEVSKLISLVFQNPTIPMEFTAYEMVAMGCYLHGDERVVVESSLKRTDTWELRGRKMAELSGGERQRVYIARALATKAPILLFDEPTAHLDLRHRLEIWRLLQGLKQEGKVILISTHDLITAKRACDAAVILSRGKCIAAGTAAATLTPAVMREIFGVDLNDLHPN